MPNQQLQKLFNSSDFKSNPLQAIAKRLYWRLWWKISNRPLVVSFANTLKINIPKTGSGAGIYYQGFSEPDTADFFYRFLRPGMVMLDVGAHIGEYTLLAAKIVEASGQVHAFEPQSHLFPVLKESVQLNELSQVKLNCSAVSDYLGNIEFQVLNEPSMSSIKKKSNLDDLQQMLEVPCTSLDIYWQKEQTKIDLIKVDVEGAEKFVLQGAVGLLSLPSDQAPTWIFEYAPSAYADFGYQGEDVIKLLQLHGYEIYIYYGDGKIKQFDPGIQIENIENLIATKDKKNLANQIHSN
jgi:FkbM family methyltransferase